MAGGFCPKIMALLVRLRGHPLARTAMPEVSSRLPMVGGGWLCWGVRANSRLMPNEYFTSNTGRQHTTEVDCKHRCHITNVSI